MLFSREYSETENPASNPPAPSPVVLDALPIALFLVDRQLHVHWANRHARQMIVDMRAYRDLGKGGAVLGCIHALSTTAGCGIADACSKCTLHHAANEALAGQKACQAKTTLHVRTPTGLKDLHLLVTATPVVHDEQELALLVLQDVSELIRLRSLIPICSSCKKIRNDESYWQTLEAHFRERLDVEFTHGICPDCLKTLYPERVPS